MGRTAPRKLKDLPQIFDAGNLANATIIGKMSSWDTIPQMGLKTLSTTGKIPLKASK